jgi:hypothetical protein
MRDLLNEPISSTLDEATGFVDAQAARLSKLRDRLADDDLAIPALDRVADELEALGERLATLDDDEIVDVVRGLASRRGPWLFAAAGAAVGVLAWAGLRRAGGSEDDEDSAARGELESSTGREPADET